MDWPNLIDWRNVIAGAVLGFLLSLLPFWLRIFKNLFLDPNKNYYGKYYLYNWSVSKRGTISRKVFEIERNIFGKPKVRMSLEASGDRDFIGHLYTAESNLYMNLRGKKHGLSLHLAFHDPLTKRIECLHGVFAGGTSTRDPLAGKVILSRKEMSEEQVRVLLGDEQLIIVGKDHLLNDPDLDDSIDRLKTGIDQSNSKIKVKDA